MAAPLLYRDADRRASKNDIREIIYDVAETFDISGAAEPRAVPHITLYGPYNTNDGRKVKRTLTDIYQQYDIVTYVVDGFDQFS